MQKTVCELFAGVGGFRVGLEKSSDKWVTVWANQWEPSKKSQHAYECYREHFEPHGGINEYTNTDISKVPASEIPDHTLLVGGFPCQDYSVASTGAKGIQGKKGVLWWEIERIVEEKQPKFLLLENVDRLLKSPTSQRGRDFGVMLACLGKMGYTVEWRVINAAEYGFQQRRRRIFIFASHPSTDYNKHLANENIKDVIYKNGFFSSKFPVVMPTAKNIKSIDLNEYKSSKDAIDIKAISDEFSFPFLNSGLMVDGKIYTSEVTVSDIITDRPITLFNLMEDSVDEKYFLTDEELPKWEYIKGAKAIERTSKTGHKYMFREGAVPFPDIMDRAARTMLTSESSKNRSTHVVKDKKTSALRKLTPVECERINGFPDNWTNTGMPHSFRYFCMGNALVVNLIEIMGQKLIEIIDKES